MPQTTRAPFSPADYQTYGTPGFGCMECQWGWSPEAQASGTVMEVYRDGSYMFAVQDDEGRTEDEIVVAGDIRDFEVDSQW